MSAFGTDGFHATSLDALAASLGVTKQTILHHFGSKDGLLRATTDAAAAMLSSAVSAALAKPGNADQRLTRVVNAIFNLAARRPELLGFVRDLSRLGATPLANLRTALEPFLGQASRFVAEEMFDEVPVAMGVGLIAANETSHDTSHETVLRRQLVALDVVLAGYAAVLAAAAEVEVLRSLGVKPTGRLFLRRRRELIEYLRSLAQEKTAIS
jgi:TetR/AcrR family transcriptional regulator